HTGSVYFFRIDEDSPNPSSTTQALSQGYYAQTFPWQSFTNHDINLWWVEDGTDGVPPGIKYGYLELSTETPVAGDQVYSFWQNPVTSLTALSGNGTLLHSAGSVLAPNSYPGSTTPANFIDTDLYVTFGGSGSANIGTGRHNHQVIGVTSTGPWLANSATEGPGRRIASIRYLLDLFDADKNNVLDAIEYDFLFTRSPRDFYRMEFDTPLKRAMWRIAPPPTLTSNRGSITSAPGFSVGRVDGSSNQFNDGLWHSIARF